ncbi:hypothetical protein KEU06_02360 [Pseudaminobacter sp. 19-2017]|uniref:Serine/threonine protein kinase n=1 Tax=Pseudaminobacter soli (ex Zhang et al. 2022) TaxID=2831468 RepID=A0A942DVY5_9HYPH|nr:hypothetical protein [Pseudaminobacter soli]MBS3647467.1 hypothetical protein [Pseudaminobacter soli]
MRALGADEPPRYVSVLGSRYQLAVPLKHDSWAATAIYADETGERITCKFGRTQSVLGIPMSWLGRLLARREAGFLRRLERIEFLPKDLGPVTAGGRVLPNAIARTYVDGNPFRDPPEDRGAFFVDLRRLVAEIHADAVAYVDLHKRENIIVDPAGRPYLIDFQVCLATGDRWPYNGRLMRFLVGKLQEMDDYHVNKHYARCMADLLSPEEIRRLKTPPGFISAHRSFAVPLRSLRRRLLVALKVRAQGGRAETEFEPEDAFRNPGSGSELLGVSRPHLRVIPADQSEAKRQPGATP